MIKGKETETGLKRMKGSKRAGKRNLYVNPIARDREAASDEYKALIGETRENSFFYEVDN